MKSLYKYRQKVADFNSHLKTFYVEFRFEFYIKIKPNLSWKSHIDYISLKLSRIVGIIARIRHFTPKHTLERIYYALMHPYLTYGLTVWGQACKTDLNQLLVLQKRAVRLINFGCYRDHAIPFFIKSNILPLDFLYFFKYCVHYA